MLTCTKSSSVSKNYCFCFFKRHISCSLVACLLAPGAFPDEDGGFGPHPGAHSDSRPKHGEQVDFLHHEARPVLDGAFRDRLVGLRGDRHVGFAPVGNIAEMISRRPGPRPLGPPTPSSRMTEVHSNAASGK